MRKNGLETIKPMKPVARIIRMCPHIDVRTYSATNDTSLLKKNMLVSIGLDSEANLQPCVKKKPGDGNRWKLEVGISIKSRTINSEVGDSERNSFQVSIGRSKHM